MLTNISLFNLLYIHREREEGRKEEERKYTYMSYYMYNYIYIYMLSQMAGFPSFSWLNNNTHTQ